MHRLCTLGKCAPAAAFVLALTAQTPGPAGSFNPGLDFSLSANPSGPWQFGYSADSSLSPEQFRLFQYAETVGGVGFWHPAKSEGNGPGYYPYAAFNTGDKPLTDATHSWLLRPGEVAMEASNTGQYSLVRFVVPAEGIYEIRARFEGIHTRLSTTDVHVLRNGISLFEADIDGYGGDPALHTVAGAAPSANWSAVLEVKASETITFAVGYGKNRTHFNDTTGLIAIIRRVT